MKGEIITLHYSWCKKVRGSPTFVHWLKSDCIKFCIFVFHINCPSVLTVFKQLATLSEK